MNFVVLNYDNTSPASVTLNINSSAIYTGAQIVSAQISTTDTVTTNYQMLIWGDVDNTYNSNIQTTQVASTWISYSTTQSVKLSTGDSSKSLNCIVRDDVWNPSTTATHSITLDTAIPVVTVTALDLTKISKVAGKNVASFSFTSNLPFSNYKVKIVPNSSSLDTAGTLIGMSNGSIHMSGTGSFPASTPITTSISGLDFELAGATEDPAGNVVKIFVQDSNNNLWSV